MRRKIQLLTVLAIFIFLLSGTIFSNSTQEKPSLHRGPIVNQFKYVLENSSSFEDSKVVKTWWIAKLRNNVTDTITMYQDSINTIEQGIIVRDLEIDSLKVLLNESRSDYKQAVEERDGISFFSALISKGSYKSIMWSFVAVLGLALIVFIVLFKRSNSVTQKFKKELKATQDEFEAHRKRALEREEKKVRELYDEILKYKEKLGKLK